MALLVVVVKLCIRRSNTQAHLVSSAKDIHAADTLPQSNLPSEHYPLRSDLGIVENDLGNEAVADEIEAKSYKGWIFANAASPRWTASYPNGEKFQFQNPVRQNFKHLCVISEKTGIARDLLIPIVAFGSASDFKTEIPDGVMHYQDVPSFIRSFSTVKIKPSQLPEIVDVFREWNNAVAPTLKLNHVKNILRRTGRSS